MTQQAVQFIVTRKQSRGTAIEKYSLYPDIVPPSHTRTFAANSLGNSQTKQVHVNLTVTLFLNVEVIRTPATWCYSDDFKSINTVKNQHVLDVIFSAIHNQRSPF